MWKLTDYVSIKVIFETLEALPVELREAREDVWLSDRSRRDAAVMLDSAQRLALQLHAEDYAACKNNEQRDQFKWELFANDGPVITAQMALHDAEDSLSKAKDRLADIQDKFSAILNQIRLIQSLTALRHDEYMDFEMQVLMENEAAQNGDDEIPF